MVSKTIVAVITFHPDVREVQKNILTYVRAVDRVLVWLNSDEMLSAEWDTPELAAAREKIVFLGAGGGNVGIGRALNEAVRMGVADGYEYILTMDQDSRWENAGAYLSAVAQYADDPMAGIFTPSIDRGDGRLLPFNGHDTIQSGAVFRLSMFRTTGLFNESYFVDSTDHEFCYRAGDAGFRIVKVDAGLLRHHLGYARPIPGTRYMSENYSAARLFYLYRSFVWIRRFYPKEIQNECYRHFFKDTFLCRFKWILLGEDHKAAKLWAIVRGISAGLLTRPAPAPELSRGEIS